MKIIGLGSAIVECVRIGRMIERHGELFLTRVYSAREVRYCRSKKYVTEHFAGCWAAKEAIAHCLGEGWRRGRCWTDIEIRIGPSGPPQAFVCGAARDRTVKLEISDILLTIAHCRAYATAQAIAVGR